MIHPIRKSHQPVKISWWQLYLLSSLFMVLLLGITFLHIPARIEHLLEIGTVIIFYDLMLKWVKANGDALPDEKPAAPSAECKH